MKIYISGKISGLEKAEFEAKFKKSQEQLEANGWEVVNPCNVVPAVENPTWLDYMKADIAEMLKCDAIFMQLDWTNSNGAIIEHDIAYKMQMEIYHEFEKIPFPPVKMAA